MDHKNKRLKMLEKQKIKKSQKVRFLVLKKIKIRNNNVSIETDKNVNNKFKIFIVKKSENASKISPERPLRTNPPE